MTYSSDKPQVKAAKESGRARRQRAEDARRRKERLDWFHAHPGVPGHPLICVCVACEKCRNPL